MAAEAATAWVWSGVETETASKFLCSFSMSTLQSSYTFASGYLLKVAAPFNWSTSHRKAIFAFSCGTNAFFSSSHLLINPAQSLVPFPPAPIVAIYNVSLGAVNPRPNTWRGTM